MSFHFIYNYPQVAKESGFKLRNYKDGPLDWRLIGSLEVERILREQNLEQIDAVLNHLSEAPLGSILESNILDSGIAKYFVLSQFSLQYLLFCRKFLEETVAELRDSHGVSQIELVTLKRSLSEANNEIIQLHKKITQMEAIHEVIYPCHLCTKNFVSNDALNLHISRKHNGVLAKSEKKAESQYPLFKERENDLTLINTIKLELEIKKLKERLNNAEREIKEKSIETDIQNVSQNVKATFDKSEQISVHSIGIQSNLSENKERDDNSEDDLSTSSQDRHQLYMLKEKLQEFEKWKEDQKVQNTEFLTQINMKFQELSTALELTRQQRQLELQCEKQNPENSVDDLEILLNKKLEDICKASAAKLEIVVNKMEFDYKVKLEQLEKGLMKLNEKSISKSNINSNECLIKNQVSEPHDETKSSINKTLQVNNKSRENLVDMDYKSDVEATKTPADDKYAINDTSLTGSNHTFIKHTTDTFTEKSKNQQKFIDCKSRNKSVSSYVSEDDSTDISASFLDEENVDKINIPFKKINTNKTQISNEKKESQKLIPAIPKIVTKKEAKKLTSNRLLSLGINMGSKSLPTTLKKRISNQLLENRNKFKQRNPQYYATRNNIKMFIDKLCSTKMPENAEALLKATKPTKPIHFVQKNTYDKYQLNNEQNADALNNTSITESRNFKQRLDSILASPIRKPDERITKAVVHQQNITQKPIPMPRKRVAFNQSEIREKHLDNSITVTDSDESQ